VISGISPPEPGGEDGDRLSARIQTTAMRGRINSMGPARDHDAPGQCKPSSELASKREGVFVGPAGTDHRHGTDQLWKRPAEVKFSWAIPRGEIQEACRPTWV
jgi:hypothetical protein